MKNISLHWKILIGMALGVLFGFIMSTVNGGGVFISNWINGKRPNTTQKVIKKSIIEGFGFIRYFKNMLLAKNI